MLYNEDSGIEKELLNIIIKKSYTIEKEIVSNSRNFKYKLILKSNCSFSSIIDYVP